MSDQRGGGSWFPLIAYALVGATTQLLWLTYTPITTESTVFYGVDVGAIGVLAEIFPFAYVVLAIPAGLALDRWFRPSLAIGAILTAIGGAVRMMGGDSFEAALAGQILVALAQPLVLNSITRLSVEYLPRHRRTAGLSIGSAGLFAGMALAFISGGLLGGEDLGKLLQLQATFGVVSVVLLLFAIRHAGRFSGDVDLGPEETPESTTERPLHAIWADRELRLLILVVAVGFGVFVAMTTWLQALLAPAGVTVADASAMLLAMVVAGVVGAAILPTLAARRSNQSTWMLIATGGAGLGCLTLALFPGLVTGMAVSILLGFLLLAMLPIVLEIVEARSGSAASTATALVWLAGNAGGLLVALAVQLLVDRPLAGFSLMALMAWGLGVPLVLAIRRIGAAQPSTPRLSPP